MRHKFMYDRFMNFKKFQRGHTPIKYRIRSVETYLLNIFKF